MAIIKITEEEYKKKFGVQPFTNQPISSSEQPIQHQTIESLKTQQADAEKEANKGLFGRTVKELPHGAMQVGLGGPAQFVASALEAPKAIATQKASDRTYKIPGLDPFKSIQSEAQQSVQEGQSVGKTILTKGLKTVSEGLETAVLTKGIQNVAKSAAEARNNNKIWNLIQPKLNVNEQAEAVKSGQIAKTGLFGKVSQVPDQEMIDVTRKYIKSVDPIKAVGQMQDGIATEANTLRSGLKQSKAIWNRNELMGAINKNEQPHLLSGDIKKAYEKSLNLALKEAEKSPKSLDGLLDVRQNFDRIVAKQYPNLYASDTLTPIKSAVMDTRRAINSLIESKLPETADKAAFVQSLRTQTKLYEAIDNVATKVPKVGTNALSKFKGSHTGKALKYAAEGIIGYEGIKKVFGR
jgi:hypothetical protein